MYSDIHYKVYIHNVMYQYTLDNDVYTNVNVKFIWRTQT